MKIVQEFKEFAMRGNVMDMAIGVILGASFGKIVSSLVADVLMPPLGLVLGKMDFSGLFVALDGNTYDSLAKAKEAGAATVNYGLFINTLIDFVIVAFVIFLVIKQINRLKKQPAPAEPSEKPCPSCTLNIPLKATRCPHCTSELKAA